MSCFEGRDHVRFAFGTVARHDLPGLVRSGACLVQPYTRFLTPGIAVLGLTFGRPIIAPDSASLRALLPAQAHRFLFDPSSPLDFRRAVTEALKLGGGEQFSLRAALLDHAHYLRPERTARAFGHLLDDVVSGLDPLAA
jgi:glycosyltransferase involved in cell wall biosynthesis